RCAAELCTAAPLVLSLVRLDRLVLRLAVLLPRALRTADAIVPGRGQVLFPSPWAMPVLLATAQLLPEARLSEHGPLRSPVARNGATGTACCPYARPPFVDRGEPASDPSPGPGRSRQDLPDHLAMHVRQPVVPPSVAVRQPGVVDAHQVQHRRVDVV